MNNYTEGKSHQNLQTHVQTPSVYSNAKSFFNNNSLPCTPFVDAKEFNLNNNNNNNPFTENELHSGIENERNEQMALPSNIFTAQFSSELDDIQPTVQKKSKSVSIKFFFL